MDNSINNSKLFAPLSHEYCYYFYYLSVAGFVLMILSLVSFLYIGITRKKGSDFYILMTMVSLSYFIFYFQNRLHYSICVKSLV